MIPSSHPPFTPEQLQWISHQTEQGVRKGIRFYARRAAVGFLILLAGTAYGFYSGTHAAIERETAASFGSCRRVNVLRAQSNISDGVSFKIITSAAKRERALTAGDPENASFHRASAKTYDRQAQVLRVTPLTDCNLAVKHPLSYSTPSAGPLGNPVNGKLSPVVQKTLADSERLVKVSQKH